MNSHSKYFGFLILLLTAFIWGTSFITQAGAVKSIEACTFNAIRCPMGALVLIPFIIWRDIKAGKKPSLFNDPTPKGKRDLIMGAVLCGLFMTGGMFFQTIGLYTTTVAKSGFITAIYVILVPILGSLFLHTFVRRMEWMAAVLCCVGMYFICITNNLTIEIGDLYTIICAFCYAGQCLAIERYANKVDGIRLSFLQLIFASFLSFIGMLLFESPNTNAIMSVMWCLAYSGIMAAGMGYTLQIIGQAYCSASTACITMSMESVFAMLSGIIILNQIPTLRETFGCVLVFMAVLLAQMPTILKSNKIL